MGKDILVESRRGRRSYTGSWWRRLSHILALLWNPVPVVLLGAGVIK